MNQMVCVVGAGTMGRGIAQVALSAGHLVALVDPQRSQLEAARSDIAARLGKRHPEITADLDQRLVLAATIEEVSHDRPTILIEAALEDLDVKSSVLTRAAAHFGEDSILATNTSSLSITAIAARTPRPGRVVGMHFFNPVPVMKLVEVVRGLQTEDEVVATITSLAESWDKQVAHVRSAPGFIVNRVARSFYGEALRLVEEQVTDAETIDAAMRGAGRFRMGPFELMDLIGNDVNAAVTRSVWTAFNNDARFAPSRIQDELVSAGRLGRKSGQGFYSYREVTAPTARPPRPMGSYGGRVRLECDSEDLNAYAERSGAVIDRIPADAPRLVLPGGTALQVTRGRTARAEAGSGPVVIVDRCIDPAEVMALPVAASHPDALDEAIAFLRCAGVEALPVADTPGLVIARTLAMIANEAYETALHGLASPADIDLAMRLGTNYPIGPFEWTDRWSAPVVLEVIDALWDTYHDPRYRASRGLREAAD